MICEIRNDQYSTEVDRYTFQRQLYKYDNVQTVQINCSPTNLKRNTKSSQKKKTFQLYPCKTALTNTVRLRSEDGLTLKTTVSFETPNGSQFTLSTQLIISNYRPKERRLQLRYIRMLKTLNSSSPCVQDY